MGYNTACQSGRKLPRLADIERVAAAILDLKPCPVVEYRLRRDVFMEDSSRQDPGRLRELRRAVEISPGAIELSREQERDGSWGRFHSMDSSTKARFVTSERAIERALALGLDRSSPILARATAYMTACLRGEADWSDREEKSEAWFEGKKVITAAMLSLVEPDNTEVTPVWRLWVRAAEGALGGEGTDGGDRYGNYSLEKENRAFRQLTGVAFVKGYLRSVYALSLLGSRGGLLPPDLSRAIVQWIWSLEEGMGYLAAQLPCPDPRKLEPWLKSLEVLSGFPGWQDVVLDAIAWLWEQRQPDGLWDFGQGMRPGFGFPLSDNWIGRGNRMIDHSTRVLALLRKAVNA